MATKADLASKSDRKLLESRVKALLNLPSNAEAERVVKTVFTALNEALVANSKNTKYQLRIIELGTFRVVQKKATNRRNPKTGETFVVPARKQFTFKFAKALRPAKAAKAE